MNLGKHRNFTFPAKENIRQLLSENAYTLFFVCLRLRIKHLHSKYYHQSLIDITAMYNFADFSKAKWEIKKNMNLKGDSLSKYRLSRRQYIPT